MPNITMTLEKNLLSKARRVAMEKNLSLTHLIRQYLVRLVTKEDLKKQDVIKKLRRSFEKSLVNIGQKAWTRGDLHER